MRIAFVVVGHERGRSLKFPQTHSVGEINEIPSL